MMRFYEDIRVGDRVALGSHLFTVEDIKAFALQYDPQHFHIDETTASGSHFGGLVASGWQTASLWMRKMIDYRKREAEALMARGEPVPVFGPSPGFRDMRWHRPVFPGDTVRYATEVLELRISRSRPDWGLVNFFNTGANQHDEHVLSFIGTAMVERRDKSPPP